MPTLPAPPAPGNGPIVFLGDSLTAAHEVPPGFGYVELLAQHFPEHTFLNQGRPGWSTGSYTRRWDEVAPKLPPEAGMVCIQLGANDLREFGHTPDTLPATVDRMRTLLQRTADRCPNAKLVILAPPGGEPARLTPAIRAAGFGERTNPLLAALADQYKALADELGVGYINLTPCIGDHPMPPPTGPGRVTQSGPVPVLVWRGE